MLSNGVKRELTWLIGIVWLTVALSWITEAWTFWFVLLGCGYVVRHLWSMHRFEKWMQGDIDIHEPSSGLWSELCYLVSRKQRALEKHAELNFYRSEQFKAASMLLPAAVISVDKKNAIEWLNDQALDMLGLRAQDKGLRLEYVIRNPEFLSYYKANHYQKPLTVRLNNARVFEFKVIPYFETHKLLIASDITDLYNIASIRRDFVANASHELRTPLTVLHGYLELMQDMPHDDQWSMPLEHMNNQTVRMSAIIEDLLTLSAMESDSIDAEFGLVDVPSILNPLMVEAEQLLTENHTLKFEIDESLMISGFAEPLKSVFTNLVSNAVRYSPEGGEICVKWYKENEFAYFCVSDEGLGIAPKHLPRLTERFYRVDKDRSRVTGGTGLGLAIVKHVLEKHGSYLEIESTLGQGSTFCCKFALKPSIN